MPRKFIHGDAARLAKIAGLTLLLPGCLTNSPKAVVTDASVTEPKIAGDAVTSAKILNGTIQTADLADSSVTTAKIASGTSITGASSTWSGTLGVTGASTLTGAVTTGAGLTVGTTLGVTGASTFTGAVTGAETFTINKIDATNYATAVGKFGISSTIRAENTAASTELYYGGYFRSQAATGQTSAQMVGAHGQIDVPAGAAGAIITTGIGVDSAINFSAAGTISNAYAFHGAVSLGAGPGVITSYRGLYLEDPGGGYTVNRYGIYSDGAIYNYFAGRVGIGQAAPTYELDVTGAGRFTGAFHLTGISAETNGNYLCVEASGEVTNGGANCASSDARLKKDIRPIRGALEKVLSLKGVTFNWKEPIRGNQREIGLIAQDVLPQFPEAVNQNSKGFYQVNYDGLVGPLVESIKELYSKLTTTDGEVKQQQLRLGQLERKIELENIALRGENKALKDRLEKIEQALAMSAPKPEPKKGRKLASVKASR